MKVILDMPIRYKGERVEETEKPVDLLKDVAKRLLDKGIARLPEENEGDTS
jgi:hypothetical protein